MSKNFNLKVSNLIKNYGKVVDISKCHNQVPVHIKKSKKEPRTKEHIHRKGNYLRFNPNTNCYVHKCYVCSEEYEIPKN